MSQVVKAATAAEIARAKQTENANAIVADDDEDEEVEYLVSLPTADPHPLRHPMKFKGVEYREVTFSTMLGEHFMPLQVMVAKHGPEYGIIAALTNLPVTVVKKMAASDYARVWEIIQDFLPQEFLAGAGEPTGDSGQNTSVS